MLVRAILESRIAQQAKDFLDSTDEQGHHRDVTGMPTVLAELWYEIAEALEG